MTAILCERALRQAVDMGIIFDRGDKYIAANLLNISETGLLLECDEIALLGEHVTLFPDLNDGASWPVQVQGVVVRSAQSLSGAPAMAVRFFYASVAQIEQLRGFLRALKAREEAAVAAANGETPPPPHPDQRRLDAVAEDAMAWESLGPPLSACMDIPAHPDAWGGLGDVDSARSGPYALGNVGVIAQSERSELADVGSTPRSERPTARLTARLRGALRKRFLPWLAVTPGEPPQGPMMLGCDSRAYAPPKID